MDNYQIKQHARISLKGNWGLGVALYLLVFILTIGLTFAVMVTLSGGIENFRAQEDPPLFVVFGAIIVSLALIPLNISVYWFFLSLIRFEGPKISDVFAIFKDGNAYFKLILVYIISQIFIMLWSFLFLIPGIIKSLSYSQSYYLLKDHPEYTALEAITESKKRMKGYKGKYFLLNLSFIGWGILSMLTFGIGFIWLTPYIYASQATFYNEFIYIQDENIDKETL